MEVEGDVWVESNVGIERHVWVEFDAGVGSNMQVGCDKGVEDDMGLDRYVGDESDVGVEDEVRVDRHVGDESNVGDENGVGVEMYRVNKMYKDYSMSHPELRTQKCFSYLKRCFTKKQFMYVLNLSVMNQGYNLLKQIYLSLAQCHQTSPGYEDSLTK